MYWGFQAIYTQTTSTGTVTFKMTANERMTFLWGQIGKDDYASGRAVGMLLFDADDNQLATLESEASVDNQHISFPKSDISLHIASDGPEWQKKIEMSKGDYVKIVATSLLATETLTIVLRALIKTTKPIITISTSAGTIPGVVSYNKVF